MRLTRILPVALFCAVFMILGNQPPPPPKPVDTTIVSRSSLPGANWPKTEVYIDNQELDCLMRNIYWEAKGEGFLGMLAVANVTLNRVKDPKWPKSICEVVYQPYQFSWTLEPSKLKGKIIDSDMSIYDIAMHAYRNKDNPAVDVTEGATWFHATYIKPPIWTRGKEVATKIGRHIFYRGDE